MPAGRLPPTSPLVLSALAQQQVSAWKNNKKNTDLNPRIYHFCGGSHKNKTKKNL